VRAGNLEEGASEASHFRKRQHEEGRRDEPRNHRVALMLAYGAGLRHAQPRLLRELRIYWKAAGLAEPMLMRPARHGFPSPDPKWGDRR
jgi:hypothetical protein